MQNLGLCPAILIEQFMGWDQESVLCKWASVVVLMVVVHCLSCTPMPENMVSKKANLRSIRGAFSVHPQDVDKPSLSSLLELLFSHF